MSLEQYAAEYQVQRAKVVAASLNSRDVFHGQWLLLHFPFDDPWEFVREDILALVPQKH